MKVLRFVALPKYVFAGLLYGACALLGTNMLAGADDGRSSGDARVESIERELFLLNQLQAQQEMIEKLMVEKPSLANSKALREFSYGNQLSIDQIQDRQKVLRASLTQEPISPGIEFDSQSPEPW